MPKETHEYMKNFSDISYEKLNSIPNDKNHQSKLGAWIDKWEDKNYENEVMGSQVREFKYLVSGVLGGLRDRWKDFVKKPTQQTQSAGR